MEMGEIMVRKAELKDKEQILNILDEFREVCILQIFKRKEVSTTAKEVGNLILDKLILSSEYIMFVAEEDGEIVGIITAYLVPMLRMGKDRVEVEEFYVKPRLQGKGVAKELMDAVVAWAKENKATKINLESDFGLDRGHHFYEKYGFKTEAKRFVLKLFL